MRRLIIVLLLGIAALMAGCCAVPSQTVPVVHDQTYPATGLTGVNIENDNGRVTVTGWAQDQVQVRVLNGRGIDRVDVETSGDRMTVQIVPSATAGVLGAGAECEVHVPASLAGIEVRTSNGQIQVVDCNGTVDAETSNGGIRLTGTRTIERLETSNGVIEAEIRALEDDARVTTSNGAVRLALAPTLNAEIDARTSNGQVTVSGLSLNTTSSGQNEVRGTLGAGGPRLTVETSNGAIALNAL